MATPLPLPPEIEQTRRALLEVAGVDLELLFGSYARHAGAAASWRARVLADLELDRPWYARQRDAWLKHV